MQATHDRIIAQAAKTALGPLGFKRKGRSRTWLADNGWWLTIVEFQPSGWSKGSYLNVAAHWLWSEIDALSFDFGGRIAEFIEYVSDDQFTQAAVQLADAAAAEAQRLAGAFTSLNQAAELLLNEAAKGMTRSHPYPSWSEYNAGVAAALAGRIEDARTMFTHIVDAPASPGSRLHPAAARMARLLMNPLDLQKEVNSLIEEKREELKLPPISMPAF